ncbi:MAG: family 20 glycosylhydrolase, partial [Actinomycetota bacterium]
MTDHLWDDDDGGDDTTLESFTDSTLRKPMAMLAAFVVIAATFTVVPLVANWATPTAEAAGGIDNLVPRPTSLVRQNGTFEYSGASRILFQTRSHPVPTEQSLEPLAEVLAYELELVTGMRPAVVAGDPASAGPGDIVLSFDQITADAPSEAEQDQSYRLTASDRVVISSQWYKGVAYGTSTLTQALVEDGGRFTIPAVQIEDRPASGYRAVMIDIARQRHTTEGLREIIDLLRQYKTRYLHLHLTDDQNFAFPFGPVTDNLGDRNYTISRADWLDLVSYADARGVTIIPELDLPGHSTKLMESGYINATNHGEVAAPENYNAIKAIIDDMNSVFASSPYFHIGGDESSAGAALVPFLAEMNRHIRSSNRRMLVWEGFHGAPAEIPATGDDRVIVLAWEGGQYNAPWGMLEAGYELINASWSPMYVVGRGGPLHLGGQTRMWSPREIHAWDADRFSHWAGTPVFRDEGPNDPDRTDSAWRASYIGRDSQVLGGQLLFWEQWEYTVLEDLEIRLPVMAEKLWNPAAGSYEDFDQRWSRVRDRVMTMVRPIEILPGSMEPDNPISSQYRIYEGESLGVTLRNRSRLQGTIHYEVAGCCGSPVWLHTGTLPPLPSPSSPSYGGPITVTGAQGVRAVLLRPDGSQVGGASYAQFANWPQQVLVTEYQVADGEFTEVPNTDTLGDRVTGAYRLPALRGPIAQTGVMLQRAEAVISVDTGGSHTLRAQTSTGRATIYIDLNRNNVWEDEERLIIDTPTSEEQLSSRAFDLAPGQYRIRVDHLSLPPLPTVIIKLNGPSTGNVDQEINELLAGTVVAPPNPEVIVPPTTEAPRPTTTVPPTTAPPTTTPLTDNPPTPAPDGTNLALDRPARTSSLEGVFDNRTGAQAVDGNPGTRWSSAYADPAWLEVDLGARYEIDRVEISWETAYGKDYVIQVSDDQQTWQDIATVTDGDGGTDSLIGLSGAGRYVRLYGNQRGTQWGFSPWEFEVYGRSAGAPPVTQPPVTEPPTTTTPPSPTTTAPAPTDPPVTQPPTTVAPTPTTVAPPTTQAPQPPPAPAPVPKMTAPLMQAGHCIGPVGDGSDRVRMSTCDGSVGQLFELRDRGAGKVEIASLGDGRCLGIERGSRFGGSHVNLIDCTGAADQTFTITTEAGQMKFVAEHSGQCLE